jgi:hypothetical protein
MAEDGDYMLVLEDGTILKSSWDYTGKGTATYANADIYEGFFQNGQRHGYGKYSYNTGEVYEGDFRENLKHGIGKMTYGPKGIYHGYFESGKRHGEGVMQYPSGDNYSGWWRDGKKHAKGTHLYKQSGMKLRGTWVDGKLSGGEWLLPGGVYYAGQFQHNKPAGPGTWHFTDGNVCRGTYKQTEEPGDDEEETLKVTAVWTANSELYTSASAVNTIL